MSRVGLFGQISDINDHLFLSGAGVLRPEKLKQKGITCVVNATIEEPTAHLAGIDTVRIRIEDSPFARLDHYFDLVADKIKSIKERGGKTLVHCVAGVSRSATLCIVYLMKYERMSLRQAYHYVKSARPIVRPNLGFWQQMVEYERKLRGHSTVTLVPVEGSSLPFPDVYSNDLRRHMLTNPGPPQNDPQLIKLQKQLRDRDRETATRVATLIPVQLVSAAKANGGGSTLGRGTAAGLGQRRLLGGGTSSIPADISNGSALRHRHSASALPSSRSSNAHSQSNNGHSASSGYSSALPWRMSSILSPAPGRRSALANGSAKSGSGSTGGGGLFGMPSPFLSRQQSSLFSAF